MGQEHLCANINLNSNIKRKYFICNLVPGVEMTLGKSYNIMT